jgi:hypothetical protein
MAATAGAQSATGTLAATSRRRWRPHLPELAIGVVLPLMYLPALIFTYGLKDDYTFLATAHGYVHAGQGEPMASTRLGRPIFGVLTWVLDAAIPDIRLLWVARALSVVGMVLFGLILYRALRLLVTKRWSAVLIALLICSLPPFVVYVGWATLFCAPYSAALGALAALGAADAAGPARVRKLLLGAGLLLLALCIYQPTAMAFWLVALIGALSHRHSWESLVRFIRCAALVGVPAMVGAYLVLKVGVWTLGAAGAQRAGLVTDIGAKLRWTPEPLGLALNLFNMPQSTPFAAAVIVAVIFGAILFCKDCDRRGRAAVLALAACTVPLSFAPNLLSEENYATFRTVGPLTATLALFVALAFVAIDRDATHFWRRLLARSCLTAIAVVSVLLGFNHLRTLIASPLSREWRLLVTQVSRLPAHTSTVGLLAPTFDEGPITARYGVRDEFGVPSSASTWADPAMVWLAGREAGTVTSDSLDVVVTVGSDARRRPSIPYINMLNLRRLR